MDHDRFDNLIRSLASGASRRRVLANLGGGLVALITTGSAGSDKALAKKRRRGVKAQGPCGDGSGKANDCEKDKDCCTGWCDNTKAKKGKPGRCRCKKLGQSCEEDRTCCATAGQPMTCQNRTCQTVQAAPVQAAPVQAAPPQCGVCPQCQTCDPATGLCVAVACPPGRACCPSGTAGAGQCRLPNDGGACATGADCCSGNCLQSTTNPNRCIEPAGG